MWIPEKVYERLPVAYVVGGIATLCLLDRSFLSELSAALLVICGILAAVLRRRRRRPLHMAAQVAALKGEHERRARARRRAVETNDVNGFDDAAA